MALKTGDLIVIENTDKLNEPVEQLSQKWAPFTATEMVTPAMVTTPTGMKTGMATEMVMATLTTRTVTEKQTGKKIKLKYLGSDWKTLENNRLIGIVTQVFSEDHRDLDFIKVREQTGGVRYCRRYILENI